jgi:hypothetical protein
MKPQEAQRRKLKIALKYKNMAKIKLMLEEGILFSIKLNENTWTLGQLCNLFKLEGKRYEQYTLTFFNHLFATEEELKQNIDTLDLSKPIIILTINGNPVRTYKLNVIGKREINYVNIPNYKNDISKSLGLYKDMSEDFDHILKTFFGLHPWDGFYKDNYVDEVLIWGTHKRNDVKYIKDFSIEELKQIMPANSIKLKQVLDSQEI